MLDSLALISSCSLFTMASSNECIGTTTKRKMRETEGRKEKERELGGGGGRQKQRQTDRQTARDRDREGETEGDILSGFNQLLFFVHNGLAKLLL